ncbi:GTPase-activating protein skywalker isoform X3 [Tribolium castaneum]|uniref:GTPase-activating protein skywalker isoform X3 n=1 Tax=Tribolium castaneum TaxID=7070 RepID=UPI00077DAD1A|nr:PREDICTED: TBC1 domain family member 24 isoform X3 [Tribolium castaneum]|eukprot:XP_015835479.1 PREDICTED: TBC1 domain family member 24 isoform X3 [Tribolium castaneum]
MQIMPSVLEEVAVEQSNAYTPFVDASGITVVPPSPSSKPLKSIGDVQSLLQQGRKQDVKHLLRNNAWPVDSPIRGQLWSLLCIQHQNKSNSMSDGFYWDMVNQVFGSTELPDKPISLPPFVEPSHCQLYYLTHRGRSVADRVVSVLGYACPDIVYSPTIYPICALLLHYMSEEQCYHCMASLVASKEKTFITQTKLLYEVTWKTVMQICKKHVKGAAVHLQRHCNSSRAERIYMDWIWWIFQGLPFQHLVRVMDCFFHEGIKVLYRTAMAILILFHKSSSSPSSEWLMEIQKNGIDSALNKFCKEMPVTPQKVLKVAFGIRGLSSAYISRVFIRTEMVLKSKNVINGSRQLVRSRSSENLPNSQSQNNIQMVSHTLTIRERMSEEMYNEMGAHSPGPRTLSMGIYPIQNINSRILDHQDLLTLWSWLPVRITMYQPILLYTTEEHGCSLTTFYVRVEHHEPTLLMIKTCNNEVFGAYCSSRWGERNQKDDRGNRQAYFGTGETFLFSLYPERAKYQWVGIEGDKVGHGAELFMAADSKMITIGGGEGQAIWMDENIRFGKTDRCQTFNNPPLCPSGDFEIRVLEVYGFATDQMS